MVNKMTINDKDVKTNTDNTDNNFKVDEVRLGYGLTDRVDVESLKINMNNNEPADKVLEGLVETIHFSYNHAKKQASHLLKNYFPGASGSLRETVSFFSPKARALDLRERTYANITQKLNSLKKSYKLGITAENITNTRNVLEQISIYTSDNKLSNPNLPASRAYCDPLVVAGIKYIDRLPK